MSTDWGEATRVAGGGFGMVFFILIILALAVWIVGLIVQRRFGAKSEQETAPKKGRE